MWALVTYGVADAVAKARIGAPLRRRFPLPTNGKEVTFAHLLRCPKCVGAWVGFGLTFWPGIGPGMGWHGAPLLNLFAAAGWCGMAHVVLARLGADEL